MRRRRLERYHRVGRGGGGRHTRAAADGHVVLGRVVMTAAARRLHDQIEHLAQMAAVALERAHTRGCRRGGGGGGFVMMSISFG